MVQVSYCQWCTDFLNIVKELEDLVDAFETQEKEYMEREQNLRAKIKKLEVQLEALEPTDNVVKQS